MDAMNNQKSKILKHFKNSVQDLPMIKRKKITPKQMKLNFNPTPSKIMTNYFNLIYCNKDKYSSTYIHTCVQ